MVLVTMKEDTCHKLLADGTFHFSVAVLLRLQPHRSWSGVDFVSGRDCGKRDIVLEQSQELLVHKLQRNTVKWK